MKIGVVNISIGNVGSVVEAFGFLGHEVDPVSDPDKARDFDMLVLAGVGNYSTAMAKLKGAGFDQALKEQVRSGKPLLGICLGMQLFADQGFEDGITEGFGWIPGKVVRIEDSTAKIPHMGWNRITETDPELFLSIEARPFYFMHSYHFLVNDPRQVKAVVHYGQNRLVAAVSSGNVTGVQFHPEKSQGDGLRFLKNLVEKVS